MQYDGVRKGDIQRNNGMHSRIDKEEILICFKEKVIVQTTAVCSETGMKELIPSTSAKVILWDSFSPSV